MKEKSYIFSEKDASLTVRHALRRLSSYLGIGIAEKIMFERRLIRTQLNVRKVKKLGSDGFAIESSENCCEILISANTSEGIANGIHELLRTLMLKGLRDPFKITWNMWAKPYFKVRGVVLGCYNFGLPELTPDMWTLENWKEYIDFLRLMNINLITCLFVYAYHQEIPQTERYKWRYETLRNAMKYGQELGIKFHFAYVYNYAPQALWWKHPELRAQGTPGYYGISFCWHRAKSEILKLHRGNMEFFKGLDGYQLMYLEGCGLCICPECSKSLSRTIIKSFREIKRLLKEINPKAEIVFWNWLAEVLPVVAPNREIKNLQDDLLEGLPKGTLCLDASGNFWRKWVRTQGMDPEGIREQLNLIHEFSHRALNLLFFMDVEGGLEDHCSVFPYPFLNETINEIRYTKENLYVEGVLGYRLAPPVRFLSDYFFFRLAFDPDLTMGQLVDEAAEFLTSKPENKEIVRRAIERLESFWNNMDAEALIEATELFRKASEDEPSKTLGYVANGTSILPLIYRLTEENLSQEEQNAIGMEIYQKMKTMYIYQGYTTENVWEARATQAYLFPRISWWTNYMKKLKNRLK